MRPDATVYAYRMPEDLSLKHSLNDGEILASKTTTIQLQDRSETVAVLFMKIPKESFEKTLQQRHPPLHSTEETRKHFRDFLLSRGNSEEVVDKVLTRIDMEYLHTASTEAKIRASGKKSLGEHADAPTSRRSRGFSLEKLKSQITQHKQKSSETIPIGEKPDAPTSRRSRSFSLEKLKSQITQHKQKSSETIPIAASTFEVVAGKAIEEGRILRVNDNNVAYTYSPKKNAPYVASWEKRKSAAQTAATDKTDVTAASKQKTKPSPKREEELKQEINLPELPDDLLGN